MLMAPTLMAARNWPDRPAVGNLTYADLEARVVAAASRLDVEPGAVVALWGPSCVDWIVAFHAAMRVGAVVLPLSTRWTDVELADVLQRTGAGLLLFAGGWDARARTILELLDVRDGVRALPLEALNATPSGNDERRASEIPAFQRPEHPLLLIPTSGTTGRPKLVQLSWGAAFASAQAVNQALSLGPDDGWWCALPLFHVGGLGIVMRTALSGAQLLLDPRFEPAAPFETPGVTVASFVPTMLAAVLEWLGDRPWPPGLRVAMLGGASIPPELVERCPVAIASYGLTEACSTLTLADLGAPAAARACAGRPLPGVEVRIDAPGPDGVGRILVRGPMLMDGYLGEAPVTDWLDTGDFGALDATGTLHVAARREDLIVSGGENIYPAEIEAALSAHPQVRYAAVVGVSDARWGQTPHAFVVLGAAGAPDFGDWLSPRLARYKHPTRFTVLEEMPLLGNGKVDRMALRAIANQTQLTPSSRGG